MSDLESSRLPDLPPQAKNILNIYFGPDKDRDTDHVHRYIEKMGPFTGLIYSSTNPYEGEIYATHVGETLELFSKHDLDVAPPQLLRVAEAIEQLRRRMKELGYALADHEADEDYLMSFIKGVPLNDLRAELQRLLEEFRPKVSQNLNEE